MRKFFLITVFALAGLTGLAQSYSISGTVLDKASGKPVEFATVVAVECEQWAIADAKGAFMIKNIPAGKNTIKICCLGYVTDTKEVSITKSIEGYKAFIHEDNLTLEGVVVTAKEDENSATTSRTMDRTTLDHIQMVGLADVRSLLPGGATSNPSLISKQVFNIRAGGVSEAGNPSFGTAVEVDGVRLSNNASFSGTSGVATNNIASSNVESVEVISGVPSVEYGDVGAGIVRVNTKKGIAPWMVTMTSNPKIKQTSVSKGFGLGRNKHGKSRGVLNASAEYTCSVKDQRSPYTSYDRKQLSLNYSNLFGSGIFADQPLRFSAGVSGNLGGKDSKEDPDMLAGTWENQKDNALRGSLDFNWLLNKSWITNLEFKGSAVYSDKIARTCKQYSSAAGTVALHGKESGYFVAEDYDSNPGAAAIMIPRGYWYNTMVLDDKPFTCKLTLKGNWARRFGAVNNKLKLGADWSSDVNFGKGEYSEDLSTAPSYRTYDYSEIPSMDNLALFAEDNLFIPAGKESHLNLIAGLRSESTSIHGSEYGTTTSLSPRFNAKYTVFQEKYRMGKAVRSLAFRASWGIAVKQPSFAILYPQPDYLDINVFNPTTASDGKAYYGYFIMPTKVEYNPALVWQRNNQAEIGVDINLFGTKISLAGYWNKTVRSFTVNNEYDPFSYSYTDQKNLEASPVPADDRLFSIDRTTGIVTVSDKTGTLAPHTLDYTTKESLVKRSFAANAGDPVNRYGFEWVIDFKRIKAINTDIRVDGNFYSYRYVDDDLLAYSPTKQSMVDSSPYKYIGWFHGGKEISNGRESMDIRANLTVTTHIPKVRMLVSMKLESSLMRYSRSLSEQSGGYRSYAIDNDQSYLPSADPSFADRRVLAVTYPAFFSSYWEPELKPFHETFVWAREHDNTLYRNLCALVTKTTYSYQYQKDYISPYFSANFSVTKEIGDIASISFYANNFFRNMGQIYSTKTRRYSSLLNQSEDAYYIPSFYYGLTLRVKF